MTSQHLQEINILKYRYQVLATVWLKSRSQSHFSNTQEANEYDVYLDIMKLLIKSSPKGCTS